MARRLGLGGQYAVYGDVCRERVYRRYSGSPPRNRRDLPVVRLRTTGLGVCGGSQLDSAADSQPQSQEQ